MRTPAFDLGCRFIIHALGPKYLFDEDPAGNLTRAVKSAILLADENGIRRLAMPAISTGVYGYPPEEAVPLIVNTAWSLNDRLVSLEDIRFVVSSNQMLDLFDNEIHKIS